MTQYRWWQLARVLYAIDLHQADRRRALYHSAMFEISPFIVLPHENTSFKTPRFGFHVVCLSLSRTFQKNYEQTLQITILQQTTVAL